MFLYCWSAFSLKSLPEFCPHSSSETSLIRNLVSFVLLNTRVNSVSSSHMSSVCTHSLDDLIRPIISFDLMFLFTVYMLTTPRCMYSVQIFFPNSRFTYPAAYLTFLIWCPIYISSTLVQNWTSHYFFPHLLPLLQTFPFCSWQFHPFTCS